MAYPSDGASFRDPGEVPVLDWVDKNLIDADPLYQRPLDQNRVDGILKAFSWRSFGAIVVVPQPDGRYHATDGQHRLKAAKRHPKVTFVPAVIVKADDVPAEASIFVEINKNRKNVSPLELFFAQLAAGDGGALAVQQVCQTAGVRIPKHPGNFKPNDCIAVNALHGLVSREGRHRTGDVLSVLVGAGLAPITADHIKAAEYLMTEPEFCDQFEAEDLTREIETAGKVAEHEAKVFSVAQKVPVWRALAVQWFRKTRKKRRAAA